MMQFFLRKKPRNYPAAKVSKVQMIFAFCILFCGMSIFHSALADGFPSFSIYTENEAAVESKEEYVNCYVNAGELIEEPAQIRGRGNSTWLNSEKKSYRVKFDEKQNPFNTGDKTERDWVLLSNHFDKSLLRNYTALLLASRLDGLEASVNLQNVHLYLNEQYMGVYLLCERIEANSCGLDIDESEGFLLEMDTYAAGEGTFVVGDKTYVIQSDYTDQEQIDEIYAYIDELDTAIMIEDEDTIREYMDIDSWIDAYIVEEFIMNTDVGFSSFYLYRTDENSKLYAGPLWDFDLSSGNQYETNGGSYEGLYAADIRGNHLDHQWFSWLMRMEWFSDAVYLRWFEISSIVQGVIDEAEELSEHYADDFERNFERWPVLRSRIWLEPDELLELNSHAEHSVYLINWLNARKNWLDEEWK